MTNYVTRYLTLDEKELLGHLTRKIWAVTTCEDFEDKEIQQHSKEVNDALDCSDMLFPYAKKFRFRILTSKHVAILAMQCVNCLNNYEMVSWCFTKDGIGVLYGECSKQDFELIEWNSI